jgi:outer membrane immunogenic protein
MKKGLLGLLAGTAALALTAAAAQAADLPSRVAPVAPIAAVPMFTWTGFYVGGQVGFQFNDNDDNGYYGAVYPYGYGFGDDSNDGFVAGAHAGYNFQFGSFVVGAEADIEGVFGDDDDDGYYGYAYAPAYYGYGHGNGSLDWQGSVRARLGFAFDRVLVYGTAGVAFGGFGGGNGYYGYPYYYGGHGDDTATGWTVGLGVEYAFTNNLTARLEYRFTSFDRGGDNYWAYDPAWYGYGRSNDDDFHTVRVGVSYKFGTY